MCPGLGGGHRQPAWPERWALDGLLRHPDPSAAEAGGGDHSQPGAGILDRQPLCHRRPPGLRHRGAHC